jgi:hypothetical protein
VKLALILLLATCVSAAEPDGLGELRHDPSPEATSRLVTLYTQATDPNQKFWILHELGARLSEQQDMTALEHLFKAASEKRPELRQAALRALAEFNTLPNSGVDEKLLARLDAAAVQGAQDKHLGVRGGAEDLRRALDIWRDPTVRKSPPPPERSASAGGWLLAAVRWMWVLLLPGLALLWSFLGFPVFDDETVDGRRAAAAWSYLVDRPLVVLCSAFLWFCLASLLAGYGFDALAIALGRPTYAVSGGWLRAYLAAVMCVFLPAALISAGAVRRPAGDPAASGILAVPKAVVLWGIAVLLLPIEGVYRLFSRGQGVRDDAPLWRWALEFGVLRAGYWTIAAASRDRIGLGPALIRAREASTLGHPPAALSLGHFDPRFTLLCSGPVLAFFCAFIARRQPVVWSVGLPVMLLGCAIWAWAVLAGVLTAAAHTLEGVLTAARTIKAGGDEMPEDLASLTENEDIP